VPPSTNFNILQQFIIIAMGVNDQLPRYVGDTEYHYGFASFLFALEHIVLDVACWLISCAIQHADSYVKGATGRPFRHVGGLVDIVAELKKRKQHFGLQFINHKNKKIFIDWQEIMTSTTLRETKVGRTMMTTTVMLTMIIKATTTQHRMASPCLGRTRIDCIVCSLYHCAHDQPSSS
jgi:hypothetical protein